MHSHVAKAATEEQFHRLRNGRLGTAARPTNRAISAGQLRELVRNTFRFPLVLVTRRAHFQFRLPRRRERPVHSHAIKAVLQRGRLHASGFALRGLVEALSLEQWGSRER